MAKITLKNQSGKKITDIELPDAIFMAPINQSIVAQSVRVFQNNQRSANSRTQNRGEVSYSTAKLWRQKGTGRARHGSRRAPIFVGGGKAHGPEGNQNFKGKLTKKMRHTALISSLSHVYSTKTLTLIDAYTPKKTAEAAKTLKALGDVTNTLVILSTPDQQAIRSTRNLPQAQTTQASRVNSFEIIRAKQIIMTQEALNIILKNLGADPIASNHPKKAS